MAREMGGDSNTPKFPPVAVAFFLARSPVRGAPRVLLPPPAAFPPRRAAAGWGQQDQEIRAQ